MHLIKRIRRYQVTRFTLILISITVVLTVKVLSIKEPLVLFLTTYMLTNLLVCYILVWRTILKTREELRQLRWQECKRNKSQLKPYQYAF